MTHRRARRLTSISILLVIRWLRLWLCCLLCLSLPVQAAAHAALRGCQLGSLPASAPGPVDVHAAGHGADHGPAADATAAAHHALAADESMAGHHGHHGGKADAQGHGLSDAGCVHCAACSVATALPSAGAGLAEPVTAAGGWSVVASSRVARIGIRGPERPPRFTAA